jgi:hypothetical protein
MQIKDRMELSDILIMFNNWYISLPEPISYICSPLGILNIINTININIFENLCVLEISNTVISADLLNSLNLRKNTLIQIESQNHMRFKLDPNIEIQL